jgi:hypothetical protein
MVIDVRGPHPILIIGMIAIVMHGQSRNITPTGAALWVIENHKVISNSL